jgi:hypothetical protein
MWFWSFSRSDNTAQALAANPGQKYVLLVLKFGEKPGTSQTNHQGLIRILFTISFLKSFCALSSHLLSLFTENGFGPYLAQAERLSSLPQIQDRCRRAIVDYARRYLTLKML